MKFEKPIINISMFAMENVVTDTSAVTTNLDNANAAAAELAAGKEKAVMITVTF